MSRELEDQVFTKIEACIQQYEAHFNCKFDKFVQVEFNIKGRVAGYANWTKMRVRFNMELLEKYHKQYIEDTVVHEMAHIFAGHRNPQCAAHGSDWYYMMEVLEHNSPSRCHDMETKPARKMRKFKYTCKCGKPHQVSNIKHKRIMNGSTYTCVNCGTPIWRDK